VRTLLHLKTDSATAVTKLMAVLYYFQLLVILEIPGCYCADCPLLLIRDRDIGLDYQYSHSIAVTVIRRPTEYRRCCALDY
jgi:hypothetical protein